MNRDERQALIWQNERRKAELIADRTERDWEPEQPPQPVIRKTYTPPPALTPEMQAACKVLIRAALREYTDILVEKIGNLTVKSENKLRKEFTAPYVRTLSPTAKQGGNVDVAQ